MTYAFVWFLAFMLVVDAVIIGVLVRGAPNAVAIIPLLFLLPLLMVWLVLRMLWTPFARRFPAQPIGPGAVRRIFQSARLGRLGGMNNCLIVEADDEFIHLHLMPPFTWLAPGTVSIPRARLEKMTPTRFTPGMLKGTVDGFRISLPKWAVVR